MFQLDNQFLEDIGMSNMPDNQKRPFLQHIYNELEMRVGTKLSEGMSDEQLMEFESIIDQNEDRIDSWLDKFVPNYKQKESYLKLKNSAGISEDSLDLKAEYAATQWLEINRPDYRDVVASVMEDLKREIADNKDALLG